MLIPLNTKTRQDLCLSVLSKKVDSKQIYSVAIVNLINGFGMDPLPSCNCYDGTDEENSYGPTICTTDYKVIEDEELWFCIDACLAQLIADGTL